jgi:hypothetical protein
MDMQVRYEKLLADAAECAMLRDRATDPEKRELFARLSEHLEVLAALMERAVGLQKARTAPVPLAGSAPAPAANKVLEATRL